MKTCDMIIEHVRILTMDVGDTVIDDGVIGIEKGRISLLGKWNPDAGNGSTVPSSPLESG